MKNSLLKGKMNGVINRKTYKRRQLINWKKLTLRRYY